MGFEYKKEDRIATFIFNRPEAMNAMNVQLLRDFKKALEEFRDDDDLWVAILTAAGKAFCVGADYQSVDDPEFTTTPIETPGYHQIWKPVICAINGQALGRGMGLALGCDIKVASETAQFACPEPKFGTITRVDIFEPYLPRGIASEVLLVGDSISARRAYELNLVNRVVPQEQLLNEATGIAERLCENAPLAVRGIKEMLAKNTDLSRAEADELFEAVKARVRSSEDRKEGMNAFKEKRKPKWQAK